MSAVSYMGTKRHLAPTVAGLVSDCKPGALLDVFSGMCAVGQEVAPSRQIWSNDLQHFAVLVAKCQFKHIGIIPNQAFAQKHLYDAYRSHLGGLITAHKRRVEIERDAMEANCFNALSKQFEDQIFAANRLVHGAGEEYQLFTQRYSGVYFGWKQCVEIDSIKFAIDSSVSDPALKDWLLVALCSAMARCANTTGHFAQALYPKANNISKIVGQFKRDVWAEFVLAINRLSAVGSEGWRSQNRVFQTDAAKLLSELDNPDAIGVVYADPPYTADQYSRYYHLYETLIHYDYPAARGRGLYRDDRAVSVYSHSTKVKAGVERLIATTARMGADLILSYPSNGLLPNSREHICSMITEHFGKQPDIIPLVHSHSTTASLWRYK